MTPGRRPGRDRHGGWRAIDQGGPQSAGALIRDYRREAGLTQQQLADAAGVSVGVVRDLEQRRTVRPQAESVRRLATGLRLSRRQAAALAQAGRSDAGTPGPGRPGVVRLSVLGPVTAWRGSTAIPLGTPLQRAVLGLLALHPQSGLRRTAIIDALWGDDPPATAAAMIQSYVSRLRQVLGGGGQEGLLVSLTAGYRLDAGACELDHVAFADLVSRAADAYAAADSAAACDTYARALRLWRGEPLADVDSLREHPAVTGLSLLRAEAVTGYAEAASAAGWHDRVLADLRELAAREPLNERVHARLMIALAGSGHQAAALGLYDGVRRRLDEQLGITPGAELADAHARVLRQDIPEAAAVAAARGPAPAGPAVRPAPGGPPASALPVPPARVVVPRQLPAGAGHFAGRAAELAALMRMLAPGAAAPADVAAPGRGTVVISAIGGMAGVGKTALALHFAHRVADRFPDGQLYLNLRGFDPSGDPLAPAEAVRALLDALQVPPAQIPAGLQAQGGLYRSLMAGRRMLIVLDNASDAAQVRPLLPGAGSCLVVVTSRRQIAVLAATDGAHLLTLDVLSGAGARELLAARLGTGRASGEPGAVEELAELCGRLPLALNIAAARAAVWPARPLAGLVTELRDQRSRLDGLDAGDPTASVRGVFSWSCEQLTGPAARMFRLLGVHPGPDITIPAAASLAGISGGEAGRLLAELTGTHLLIEHVPGRFAFHDLMRAYAAERAEQQGEGPEREAAIHRALDFYLHTARAADRLLNPARDLPALTVAQPGVAPEPLAGEGQALAWLNAEYRVLLAAVRWAAAARFDGHAQQLPAALVTFLDRQGHLEDYAVTQRTALAAAQRAGHPDGRARAYLDLGGAYGRLGSYEQARAHLSRALSLYRDLGDIRGQGRVRLCLGWVFNQERRPAPGLRHCQRALELFRAGGEPVWQARALGTIGWCHALLGDPAGALAVCQEAVGLHRELSDPLGEAAAWESLGDARRDLGQHQEAVACLRRSAGLYARLGEHYYHAEALTRMGDTYQSAGQVPSARAAWQQALAILTDNHLPDSAGLGARL
jgi:DNA-binding SARP family transcriptional activator/tetratricopeptide (TPR) repeat protein/DNA-binding XRE family transcriptional regulator